MPNIYTIKGVKINVNSGDHPPPHVHAWYNGEVAKIDIETLEMFKGEIPPQQYKIARECIIENRENLLAIFDELNERFRRNG